MASTVQFLDRVLVCPLTLGVSVDYIAALAVIYKLTGHSTFWHQGARQKFSAPTRFLSFSVFRLPKGTLLARYGVLILTFVTSGLLHRVGDTVGGTPWQESRALRFFVMQALGIIIEDVAQGISRTLNRQCRSTGHPTWWKRALGSVRLLFWLIWTTPGWNYPIARRSSGQVILPFTSLGWLV